MARRKPSELVSYVEGRGGQGSLSGLFGLLASVCQGGEGRGGTACQASWYVDYRKLCLTISSDVYLECKG